jgi:heme/copper-type cytochrome/quinol oxidase subunit 2
MAGAVSSAVWSNLFYLYMGIALVVGILVAGWTFLSMWRFRRRRADEPRPADAPRAGHITPERGHVLGAYIMAGGIAAIMFGLAFSTIDAVNFIEIPPVDEPAVHFEVTGFQFGWQFRYFGEFTDANGTVVPYNFTKVNDMRVPVDTVVTADVTSRDVQHVFGIPDYRVQIYATSASVLPIWFKATETGEVPIRCLRNCGVGHDDMIKAAKLTVLTRAEYDAFLAENVPAALRQQAAPAQSTQAVALLVEDGQMVVDQERLSASQPVTLKVMNREDAPLVFGAGPADAPWATTTVPAGGEAVLTFDAPAEGACPVWAKAEGAEDPALAQSLEVMPQ